VIAYKFLSLVPPYVTFASRQNVSEPHIKSFVQKTNLAYETPFKAVLLSLYEICKNGFGLLRFEGAEVLGRNGISLDERRCCCPMSILVEPTLLSAVITY
jgi:hypothetical protein